jgi:diaminohydroxyphosphoribosylaminopyrimidine deaminase/5-amino-6-(5-phosphoribosylamino)uracil reductase
MQRCLDLAKMGKPYAFPNPLVGAVVVYNNQIIGEGFHQEFGKPHAEVNAINAVENKSLLSESTIYVSLEPCSFYGKTPPCAELIIKSGIKKCVIGTLDPNPKVSGNGVKMLEKAGVEVEVGILQKEAVELNKRFFTFQKLKRPYIILKWAQTNDGFVADKNYQSKWISNQYSRTLVHKWRTEESAILVGKNTILHDNPTLTARDWFGKNPVRAVFDRNLEFDATLNIFSQDSETLIFNTKKNKLSGNLNFVKIDFDKDTSIQMLDYLGHNNLQSLFIEGGSKLLNNFLQNDLWDEARVFTGNKNFGEGISAPQLNLVPQKQMEISGDMLEIFYNPKNIIYEI